MLPQLHQAFEYIKISVIQLDGTTAPEGTTRGAGLNKIPLLCGADSSWFQLPVCNQFHFHAKKCWKTKAKEALEKYCASVDYDFLLILNKLTA